MQYTTTARISNKTITRLFQFIKQHCFQRHHGKWCPPHFRPDWLRVWLSEATTKANYSKAAQVGGIVIFAVVPFLSHMNDNLN